MSYFISFKSELGLTTLECESSENVIDEYIRRDLADRRFAAIITDGDGKICTLEELLRQPTVDRTFRPAELSP